MTSYHRLSVNINDEAAEILRDVTKRRQISTTEAIRRAIGLLGFFEDAQRDNTRIYAEDSSGHRSQVQII